MNNIIAILRTQLQKLKCRINNLTKRVAYIEENCSGMGLQSVSENGNYTDIPLFLKYLNLGESPANYYKVNIGSALFYSAQNQGITNDGTYYYTTENFTITKRLISDNSIVLVKNNPAGGNRLGGIFYDPTDNVLLVCAGSNSISSPTANVYRIDPEDLEDIEGVSLTTELPGAAINAIFRHNNDIYVGQTLSNAPGKRGIYRLNLDLEVENKVYESYKNWQDATVVGGDVYITDHNGSISVFEINQDEFKLKRIYEYNQSFREGLTHIGGINFVAFIVAEGLFKETELTNDLGNPDVKLRLNSEDVDSDILALITNQGYPTVVLTKDGWLSLGTRLRKPLAPLHIKSPISGDAFTAILLENGSNTEGSEVEIKGTLSSTSGIRTGKIAHKHFGSLGRGWEFGVTGSSYANKMWLLGNGTLLIADNRELLGDGSAKLQTDGGAFIKGKIFNENIKAETGELYNVLVDEYGEYKSSPKEVLPKIVSLSVFNQINESSVSGDDGVNLLNPDYGLAILMSEDLQEGNSFSGEFVIHIDNQDKLTAKVVELFGAEIYNNTNPSDEVIAKVNYKLDFFNPVGDNIDYKLSWQYVASGEILFGEHTDTIDSTENILFELLVTGHEDDVFTLKSAYLNRATNIEERLLSSKTYKLGSEVKNAVYSNLILGNNIPKLNTMLAIDEFISSLKTAGVWSKLDIFSLFQMNDNTLADFALYDYKRGTFMTSYGGMIYDEFGYQGNGVDGYIDTEFNPSTSGVNYTLNDASRLFWLSKNPTDAGQSYVDVSSDTPNSGNRNYFRIRGGTTRMFINQGTTLLSGESVDSSGLGFKAINRTSSTDVAVFNGTTKNARTATSSEINNAKQLLFTSTNGYSDMGLSFYAMGASLTDQDVEDIIEFYNEYLTEIGL